MKTRKLEGNWVHPVTHAADRPYLPQGAHYPRYPLLSSLPPPLRYQRPVVDPGAEAHISVVHQQALRRTMRWPLTLLWS